MTDFEYFKKKYLTPKVEFTGRQMAAIEDALADKIPAEKVVFLQIRNLITIK